MKRTIIEGFTDKELDEAVCDTKARRERIRYSPVPWFFWTTELYSLGRCYREWTGWPRVLPIPVYGDHGVTLNPQFSNHERVNKARVHLTWSSARAKYLQDNENRRIVRTIHPWIIYRRNHKIRVNSTASGTIIFYSHSNSGIEIEGYDWDSYITTLKALPSEFHPLVVCMHMHDIKKGYHKPLRQHGLPIVTAGHSSSPYFVDRFYDVVRNFRYATSNTGGSELFYCEELGVNYFIYGQEPTKINRSHAESPIGSYRPRHPYHIRQHERKRQLFGQFPPLTSIEKERFVQSVLGLDVNPWVSRRTLRKVFVAEMVRLFVPYLRRIYSKFLEKLLRRGSVTCA